MDEIRSERRITVIIIAKRRSLKRLYFQAKRATMIEIADD
jgi:hypothetical protein